MFVLQLKSKSPSWSSRSYSRSLAAALPAMLSRGLMASKLLSWAVLSTSDEDTRLSYRDLASPYISSCKRTFPVSSPELSALSVESLMRKTQSANLHVGVQSNSRDGKNTFSKILIIEKLSYIHLTPLSFPLCSGPASYHVAVR